MASLHLKAGRFGRLVPTLVQACAQYLLHRDYTAAAELLELGLLDSLDFATLPLSQFLAEVMLARIIETQDKDALAAYLDYVHEIDLQRAQLLIPSGQPPPLRPRHAPAASTSSSPASSSAAHAGRQETLRSSSAPSTDEHMMFGVRLPVPSPSPVPFAMADGDAPFPHALDDALRMQGAGGSAPTQLAARRPKTAKVPTAWEAVDEAAIAAAAVAARASGAGAAADAAAPASTNRTPLETASRRLRDAAQLLAFPTRLHPQSDPSTGSQHAPPPLPSTSTRVASLLRLYRRVAQLKRWSTTVIMHEQAALLQVLDCGCVGGLTVNMRCFVFVPPRP